MKETVERFPENPLLTPADVRPSREDMIVECLLNPGVFRFKGRTGLLLRVAERPKQEENWVSTPLLDPQSEGGIRILRIRKDDPDLKCTDPRMFDYKGQSYLSTLSHLRLAWSDGGVHFTPEEHPTLSGEGSHEAFGMEDCRVEFIDGAYWLTYTAVSEFGVAVGLISTTDWRNFTRHGVIFPPHNKDCALFPEKINGYYHALHRPSGGAPGGNFIWISRSTNLLLWGDHRCVAMTRRDGWDSERIGAGAAPIRTPKGWLEIYHGADAATHRYCLGALLLDLDDPARVLARSREPIMQPHAEYERKGFVGNVVFTNGQIVDGDRITMYYGSSDSVICGTRASVTAILDSL